MRQIGTIYATADQLAAADQFADEQEKAALAAAAAELSGLERRVVGGEVRYYAGRVYTPAICLRGRRRWFEVREDGDYPVPAPMAYGSK